MLPRRIATSLPSLPKALCSQGYDDLMIYRLGWGMQLPLAYPRLLATKGSSLLQTGEGGCRGGGGLCGRPGSASRLSRVSLMTVRMAVI